MHRLQEVVRLHRMGKSSRVIARQLSMGRDTIRCYLRALRGAGLLDGAAGERGVPRRCWLFLMTLCFSRRMYCELVFDQKIETWLALHVAAFEYFGGVPHVVVPDNLKAAVVRAAFAVDDDPVINRSYRELARRALHFGCTEYAAIKSILRQGLDLETLPEKRTLAWAQGSRFARRPVRTTPTLFQEPVHVRHR